MRGAGAGGPALGTATGAVNTQRILEEPGSGFQDQSWILHFQPEEGRARYSVLAQRKLKALTCENPFQR